ncbi:hypothetical protein ACH5RR_016520 [Cinchona calisaya]|uniref:Pentatricopeptide repeat-containing protein n=1 Tax=Cinchona calisaya TaxID=153742 RepID=A0ABD2ZW72_9GENT
MAKLFKLFDLMRSLDDDPCKKMFTEVIAVLRGAGDMKKARWKFDNYGDGLDLKADVICYTALIDSDCKSNNLQHAINLFNGMISIGLQPANVTYNALLCGYSERGDVSNLVNEMSLKGIEPDSGTISSSYQGILKDKEIEFRHKIFARFLQACSMNLITTLADNSYQLLL